MTESAQAARAIRAELKTNFPSVTFSVRSRNFSMGDAVDIAYTDGPTLDAVQAITGKYQYGHFDGMTDMYEHSNSRKDIPQAKFVHARREMSPETRARLKTETAEKFGIENPEDEQEWQKVFRDWSDSVLWREFQKLPL